MKYAATMALGLLLQPLALAESAAQPTDPSFCPSCITESAAQQSVLQAQNGQQQLSQNIQQTLNAQQQSIQAAQVLESLRLEGQLSRNNATLQTILLQNRMALLELQLIRLRADAHRREAKPKHNP